VFGVYRCHRQQLLIHIQPLPLVTARIGQDRGIFEALAKSQDGVQLDVLAETSGLQRGVLEPILDYLCTQGMGVEVTRGTYKATPLTHMLLVPLFNDAVTHLLVVQLLT
jgi:hypothetical protein